ncbi:single-stranded DNA-binding protein [Acetivibrio ethanolgignens]|uniref:Single-stranded DNA-binding protein n=1 Tax=Acetivibrio ethanolgignens TaxID=290052 RepID=A0A0V8QF31_9FIRM|nr:single-stranded DNA-binding protein [Acetivibrio ethanolgignens]KSV59159.1 hypothetical protein ASU35_10405 [Acetivibrio ethanolgignens]
MRETDKNNATLVGILEKEFEASVEIRDDGSCVDCWDTTLAVARDGKIRDWLNVRVYEHDEKLPGKDEAVCVSGGIRAYACRKGRKSFIGVTAEDIHTVSATADDADVVELTGTVCREVITRDTKNSGSITEVLLAVRSDNRTDYVPCVVWGSVVKIASTLSVGDRVSAKGRLQSRSYVKHSEDGKKTRKTAYEVRAYRLIKLENEEGS